MIVDFISDLETHRLNCNNTKLMHHPVNFQINIMMLTRQVFLQEQSRASHLITLTVFLRSQTSCAP